MFVPFQTEQDVDQDRYWQIKAMVKDDLALEIVDHKLDYKEALEIIARAHLVIGMRLHAIIFAVLTKTPFLALSYSNKVKDFVKTVNLDNWVDYENISFEEVIAKLEVVFASSREITLHLEKQKMLHCYEVFKHEQMIKDLLK